MGGFIVSVSVGRQASKHVSDICCKFDASVVSMSALCCCRIWNDSRFNLMLK